jgi:ribosomal protein S30
MYDTTPKTPNHSTLHKPYYDRMHKRLKDNLDYAKRVSKIRSKTVEPVLGTLINFTNMRRVNTRGMQGAHKSRT